jgi:hypothetical protein
MKMKEQNAYMALAGFVQILFMATSGTVAAEMFKPDRNLPLMVLASLVAAVTMIVGVTLYTKIFKGQKQKK